MIADIKYSIHRLRVADCLVDHYFRLLQGGKKVKFLFTLHQKRSNTPLLFHRQGTGRCPGLSWVEDRSPSSLYQLKKNEEKLGLSHSYAIICGEIRRKTEI